MTAQQFNLIALLVRATGPVEEARRVLVGGEVQNQVATETGIPAQNIGRLVKRIKEVDAMIRKEYHCL